MPDRLMSFFIPPDGLTTDAKSRTICGRRVSMVCIALNLTLAFGKALVGVWAGSVAIIADALNNLTDASTNVISLLGFKLASKPADAEHPYGHGRYEYLAALAVSVGIILVGIELVRDAAARVAQPTPVDSGITTIAMLVVAIAVKLWMGQLNATLGKRIDSSVLIATAADSRADAVATSTVLAAMLFDHMAGINLDGWVGMGVGAFIIWAGIGLVRETADTLLGRGPSPELVALIRDHIVKTPGILGVHGLMVHDYGPGKLIASAHVEMDPSGSVVAQHAIVDAIEHELWDTEHIAITLHVDPFERGDGSSTDRLGVAETTHADTRMVAHDSMGVHESTGMQGNVGTQDSAGMRDRAGMRDSGSTHNSPQAALSASDAEESADVPATQMAKAKRDREMGVAYKSKQMIVIRRDLKMRKGKIAAQAGHACVEATLMALANENRLNDIRMNADGSWVYLTAHNGDVTPLSSWFDAGVAKVCVYVDGEDALLDLAQRGRELGFLCALVRDAGITEFGGEPTYTCLAFEPLYPEQIDPLTGELPLF